MKRRDLLTPIVNTALSVLISLAGASCLRSAFDLSVSDGYIVFTCVILAVLACVSLGFRWGWLVLSGAALLWLNRLWRADVVDSLLDLLGNILAFYRRAYGIPIPDFIGGANEADVTLAMAMIAGICTMMAGISLCRRRALGAVIAALLPLFPCLVVTNTPPDNASLFLILLCIGLVVLSQSTRRQDPVQGSRLLAMLLIPVLLANWLLFRQNPEEEYTPPEISSFMEKMTELLDKLPFIDIHQGGGGSVIVPTSPVGPTTQSSTVYLNMVGPKLDNNIVTMHITASYSGFIYLRGRSYCDYTGTQWTAGSGTETDLMEDGDGFLNPFFDTLQIATPQARDVLYLGYYADGYSILDGGAVRNTQDLLSYSYSVRRPRSDWKASWRSTFGEFFTKEALADYFSTKETYLQLPPNTLAAAQAILKDASISETQDLIATAEQIAAYVQSSATYDLNTPYMPSSQKDFAIWFLNNGETGYCVHFATATAVLLRAAGIPARYVEGYTANVTEGTSSTVRGRQAHAWVEYYVPMVGWVMLESTPAGFAGTEPQPTPPSTTVPTTPPTTTPSLPTRPSQTTSPTLPTRPSQTTPTTAPATTPTTEPSGDPGPAQAPVDLSWLWHTLLILGCIAAGLAAIAGQWWLRRKLRHRHMYRGDPNAQALHRWRFAQLLAKLRRQKPPEALHKLAQKAKFSQYVLTQAELSQFDGYFDRSIAHLKSRPWPLELVYRLIFAAY